jgi:hypothetical protein
MSFDLDRARKDEAFWKYFTHKYGEKLRDAGWQGPLESEQLIDDANWDSCHDVMHDAVHFDGLDTTFAESDGGGIPGSADFASIKTLCGKFFVTGSYMKGGPYDTLEEALAEAGLDGDREEMDD